MICGGCDSFQTDNVNDLLLHLKNVCSSLLEVDQPYPFLSEYATAAPAQTTHEFPKSTEVQNLDKNQGHGKQFKCDICGKKFTRKVSITYYFNYSS